MKSLLSTLFIAAAFGLIYFMKKTVLVGGMAYWLILTLVISLSYMSGNTTSAAALEKDRDSFKQRMEDLWKGFSIGKNEGAKAPTK